MKQLIEPSEESSETASAETPAEQPHTLMRAIGKWRDLWKAQKLS